jgi:hypothetical protein
MLTIRPKMTTIKKVEKQTLQQLKEGVKIEANENINQLEIHVGNFVLNISPDNLGWFSLENSEYNYDDIYGSFNEDYISVNTFTNGKTTTEGRQGEIRTVNFYRKKNYNKKD